MEIRERDFNYFVDQEGKYVFYFMGYDGRIKLINDYGVSVEPLTTIKTLTIEGLRYNPALIYPR